MSVLHFADRFFYFSHGQLPSEHGGDRQVPSLARITRHHHVLGSKHIVCQLRDAVGSVLLGVVADQGSVRRDEEVEAREGDHVYCELPEVSVQLEMNEEIR